MRFLLLIETECQKRQEFVDFKAILGKERSLIEEGWWVSERASPKR